MRIAILSDIHANVQALDAVLTDLPSVDQIVCCGDVVGYYPDLNAVCTRLREADAQVVQGNHDAYVIGERTAPKASPLYGIEWTRSKLDEPNRKWLRSLPETLTFCWGCWRATIRHASPWDQETYIYRHSSSLSRIFLGEDELLFLGHTHHPMIVDAGKGRVINPGAVGQPRDWNPRASYALFETHGGSVRIHRVSYPVAEYQRRLRELGWGEALIHILGRKRRG